ncbi:MAG: hypothetical protein V1723_03050 [Candidatus Uhrbacteria bacterium]
MRNWMIASVATMLLIACGTVEGNYPNGQYGDPTHKALDADGAIVQKCGNGTCEIEMREDCASCPQDCGCADGQRCWQWSELDPLPALSYFLRSSEVPVSMRDTSVCGSNNPIIDAMAGYWQEDTGAIFYLAADVTKSWCDVPHQEVGDACIYADGRGGYMTHLSRGVLSGTHISRFMSEWPEERKELWVEILNDGKRIEFDVPWHDPPMDRVFWRHTIATWLSTESPDTP